MASKHLKTVKNKILRHKFNGITYDVDLEPFLAICESPVPDRTPAIRFPKGIRETRESLCSIIHEAIHAANWGLQEEVVDRMGDEIGKLLWKIGYRLKSE